MCFIKQSKAVTEQNHINNSSISRRASGSIKYNLAYEPFPVKQELYTEEYVVHKSIVYNL